MEGVWRWVIAGQGARPACPNPECVTPHVVRTGSLGGRQRYHCRGCGAWFGETQGTPLDRLKTPAAEIEGALVRDLDLSTVEIDEFWSFVKRRTTAASRVTRRLSGIAGAA